MIDHVDILIIVVSLLGFGCAMVVGSWIVRRLLSGLGSSEVDATKPAYLHGCVMGVAFCLCLFGMGGLLSLTVVGAIVGVPLMLFAVLALPFSWLFWRARKGKCPYCGGKLVTFTGSQKCPSCHGRVIVWRKRFMTVDEAGKQTGDAT